MILSRAIRHRLAWASILVVAGGGLFGCAEPTCDEKANCVGSSTDGDSSIGTLDASTHHPDGAFETGSTIDAQGTLTDAGGVLDTADHDTPPCGAPENCTNGIDDDCNGKIDCEDPACQPDHECVAGPPAGWSGPGAFIESAGSPPSCPAAYASDAFDGLADPSAPAATCGCTCGAPSKVTCAMTASFYYDSSCANLCSSTPVSAGTCGATCSGAQTAKVTAAAASGGSCTGTPSKKVAALSWAHTGRVCGAPSGSGCSGGGVCIAARPAPFASGACIWRSGTNDCAAPYTVKHVYYAGATDTRDCGACACGPPQNVTCGTVTVSLYGDAQCGGAAAGTVPSDGTCVLAASGAHGVTASNPTSSGGSCTGTSAGAIGSVTPTGPTTVCCIP